MQNSQLRQLHRQFKSVNKPTIVLGDFNLTAYSPRYRKLLDSADLQDAGLNQGHKITWCLGEAKAFCAPIDHILINGFVVKKYNVKQVGESDHRLVEANLVLK
jgi:endonuclease/exonuclease/phosphatase (EEP) superfamily protein YafD